MSIIKHVTSHKILEEISYQVIIHSCVAVVTYDLDFSNVKDTGKLHVLFFAEIM